MATINLRSFKQLVRHHKKGLRRFLSSLDKKPPKGLDQLKLQEDIQVWKNLDCLDCANCCKTMSPTYTRKDIWRISAHLAMTPKEFMDKWLYKDKTGDWMNKKQPCQFLDLVTNKCNIYEVRPGDCAGFPHHTKKKMVDYTHIYKQNLAYCPATYQLVERMQEKLK